MEVCEMRYVERMLLKAGFKEPRVPFPHASAMLATGGIVQTFCIIV